MRALVTIAAIGLVTTAALAQPGWQKKGARWQPQPRPAGAPLCRNAPALAALPPEANRYQAPNAAPVPVATPTPPAQTASPVTTITTEELGKGKGKCG